MAKAYEDRFTGTGSSYPQVPRLLGWRVHAFLHLANGLVRCHDLLVADGAAMESTLRPFGDFRWRVVEPECGCCSPDGFYGDAVARGPPIEDDAGTIGNRQSVVARINVMEKNVTAQKKVDRGRE